MNADLELLLAAGWAVTIRKERMTGRLAGFSVYLVDACRYGKPEADKSATHDDLSQALRVLCYACGVL